MLLVGQCWIPVVGDSTCFVCRPQKSQVMATKEGKEDAPKASDYDATEHLMSVDEVSAKYAVTVNKEQPGKSPGLSGSEVCCKPMMIILLWLLTSLFSVPFQMASTIRRQCMFSLITSNSLSFLQAASRLAENGPNKLSPPKDKPEWLKYLLQYTNPLLFLLIIAGVLTFVAYGIQVCFCYVARADAKQQVTTGMMYSNFATALVIRVTIQQYVFLCFPISFCTLSWCGLAVLCL